ncbi:hypothetical protein [Halomonas stenophila]|uniref:Uncharacterized protein n=1 Tax=Halomonas stenophila TaxID=795312 RepID=A0A7W5HKC0_9GAMM|nr:hypothetical protein [Halomonas stenophila]MBB3231700.1 hypothetical protein [Halomonas stenophila]
MAFTSFVPATVGEVLSELVDFTSVQLGWTASYDSGNEIATIDPKASEATFVLGHADNDPHGSEISCQVTKGADTFTAHVDTISGLANVWLFGGNSPEPWCHMVINSLPGDYHHLHFGYLERYGDWTCGAVADGTLWTTSNSSFSSNHRRAWESSYNHMLFGGANRYDAGSIAERMGGVLLDGANAPLGVGRFAFSHADVNQNSIVDTDGIAALYGGCTDNDNRRLIHPGLPLHNAAAPMAPFLIRADFEIDDFWVPIGAVAGVRMIHIDDFNPEQVITFGANDWQLFPLGNKTRGTSYDADHPDGVIGGTEYMGIAVLRA